MTQVLYDDLWHYSERFTRDKLQRSELLTMAYVQGLKMGDMFFQSRSTPLDYTITNDFLECLSKQEAAVFEDMSAGNSHKEIRDRNHISQPLFLSLRKSVRDKAVAYL